MVEMLELSDGEFKTLGINMLMTLVGKKDKIKNRWAIEEEMWKSSARIQRNAGD